MSDALKELDELFRQSEERTANLLRLQADVQEAQRELAVIVKERDDLREALHNAADFIGSIDDGLGANSPRMTLYIRLCEVLEREPLANLNKTDGE